MAALSQDTSNPNRIQADIPEDHQFSEAAKSGPQTLAERSVSLTLATDDDINFTDDLDMFSVPEGIGLDRQRPNRIVRASRISTPLAPPHHRSLHLVTT